MIIMNSVALKAAGKQQTYLRVWFVEHMSDFSNVTQFMTMDAVNLVAPKGET
jgi:hypothetical protein